MEQSPLLVFHPFPCSATALLRQHIQTLVDFGYDGIRILVRWSLGAVWGNRHGGVDVGIHAHIWSFGCFPAAGGGSSCGVVVRGRCISGSGLGVVIVIAFIAWQERKIKLILIQYYEDMGTWRKSLDANGSYWARLQLGFTSFEEIWFLKASYIKDSCCSTLKA